jgi:hypothetical protein
VLACTCIIRTARSGFEACVELNWNLYVGTLVEVIMSVGLSLNLYAERRTEPGHRAGLRQFGGRRADDETNRPPVGEVAHQPAGWSLSVRGLRAILCSRRTARRLRRVIVLLVSTHGRQLASSARGTHRPVGCVLASSAAAFVLFHCRPSSIAVREREEKRCIFKFGFHH